MSDKAVTNKTTGTIEKAMQGLPIHSLRPLFTPVPPEHVGNPIDSFDFWSKLAPHEKRIREGWCKPGDTRPLREAFNIGHHQGALPLYMYAGYTLDEAAKIWYSSDTMFCLSDLFDLHASSFCKHEGGAVPEIPECKVFSKITNSQWQWGGFDEDWNLAVAAYEAIRRFSFGSAFEVTLDYTTGYNEIGFSKFCRVFLDGMMAFMVHYKGQHVLTIGFSVSREGRILINQIQLKNKKGNRWLYKLPRHYMEYVIDRMQQAFVGQRIYLVNGSDLARQIVSTYPKPHIESYVHSTIPRLKPPGWRKLRRIRKLYATRFKGYFRTGRPWKRRCMRFHCVLPRAVPVVNFKLNIGESAVAQPRSIAV